MPAQIKTPPSGTPCVNGFYDMSISYIENMRELLWYDERVSAILQKALELEKQAKE